MQAYRCDLSGKYVDGSGNQTLVVPATDLLQFQVMLLARPNAKAPFQQGHVGPEAAEELAAAIKGVVAKLAGGKK